MATAPRANSARKSADASDASGAGEFSVATLGGPTTFAGQAMGQMRRLEPLFGHPRYLPSMDELWQELLADEVDVIVLGADSTGAGPGESARRVLRAAPEVYVIRELVLPYHCSLLAKPGTRLTDIRTVVGHGSVRQCRGYLTRSLPNANVRILHDLSSFAAAQQVAESDGTSAVISSPAAGRRFGLIEIAADIDDGAVGLWWAIARRPRPCASPQRRLLAGRLRAGGQLGSIIQSLQKLGYRLDTSYSTPSSAELFTYDYLLAFIGPAMPIGELRSHLAAFPAVSLVGALPPLRWPSAGRRTDATS